MKKLLTVSLLFLSTIGAQAFANGWSYHAVAGADFTNISSSNSLTPYPGLTNAYNNTQGIQSAPFLGLGVAYNIDHVMAKPITLSLGLSAYYIDLASVSGVVTPFVGYATDTLNYGFSADSVAVMLEPKIIYTAYRLQPYAFLGAGVAVNSLFNYHESTPAGSNAAPSNPYANNTEVGFAYELGAGLQYVLVQSQQNTFLIGLEYRYFNIGQGQLGLAQGETTGQKITANNIMANVVDISLSYQFK